MLNAEDKLDGTNYPMWAYMMRHVLIAKSYWTLSSDLRNVQLQVLQTLPPLQEQLMQIMLQPLSLNNPLLHNFSGIVRMVKPILLSHCQSNITLFHRVAMLKWQLEETKMQEGDSMDAFFTKIKDFMKQLLNIDEVISDKQLCF